MLRVGGQRLCAEQRYRFGGFAAHVAFQSEAEPVRADAGRANVSEQKSVPQRDGVQFGLSR